VLQAAKELAAKQKTTTGAVISTLARRGFDAEDTPTKGRLRVRNGVEMLPRRGERITVAHVQALLDEEGL
jgi:hypothetical protein